MKSTSVGAEGGTSRADRRSSCASICAVSSDISQPADDTRARLNGWKEIAAHLGKGVRTVQRWERDYGLPVRRIGREGGEIVFAFKDEIDRWTLESAPRRDSAGADEVETSSERPAEVVVSAAPTRPRRSFIGPVVAAASVAFALLLVAIRTGWPGVSQPARAMVENRMLFVSNADREPLWSHELDFEPSVGAYNYRDPSRGRSKVIVTDLDLDGRNEILLAVSSAAKNARQGLRVFNADGSTRFQIEPNPTIQFGAERFVGPWAVYKVFVLENPDRTRSIWIAFIHGLWFPTLLVEVDAHGKTKSTYWSNGYIESVAVTAINGRNVVLVGGTHNDTRGGSLAIFDYDNVAGFAPAVQDEFKCKDCPPGAPNHFLVFPRRCIAEALNGQATVDEIWVDDLGQIHALASEGPTNDDGFEGGVWYTLRPDLSVLTAEFTYPSGPLHHRLEAAGTIGHPFTLKGAHSQLDLRLVFQWGSGAFQPVGAHNAGR